MTRTVLMLSHFGDAIFISYSYSHLACIRSLWTIPRDCVYLFRHYSDEPTTLSDYSCTFTKYTEVSVRFTFPSRLMSSGSAVHARYASVMYPHPPYPMRKVAIRSKIHPSDSEIMWRIFCMVLLLVFYNLRRRWRDLNPLASFTQYPDTLASLQKMSLTRTEGKH